MALPNIDRGSEYRVRRWDALVIGSGVAGLLAATRIGMAGHSVLVVEEEASRSGYPGLREPFFIPGHTKNGPLETCFNELKLPLIDRRRLVTDSVAFQVVGPHLRMDCGSPSRSVEELVSWNVIPSETASRLVRGLGEAAEVERQILLDSPLVRSGRRLVRPRSTAPGHHVRGLPAEAANAPPRLETVLRAQLRALSNLASRSPTPEAQARLLGSTLAGGATFRDAPPWLAGLLRKRLESVYGEFRSLSGGFEFVTSSGHPGISIDNSRDLLIGRSLVVAVPGSALENALGVEKTPDFLRSSGPARRRIGVHFQAERNQIPEAMNSRVILLPAGGESSDKSELITLALFPCPEDPRAYDLVARMVCDVDRSPERVADEIEDRLRALLPFAGEKGLVRRPLNVPVWDDDGWLEDPEINAGWPGEIDIQPSHKPSVYHLSRSGVAGLGIEGDLLMGWRAGDAIATELG